jgi:hypothetical protein
VFIGIFPFKAAGSRTKFSSDINFWTSSSNETSRLELHILTVWFSIDLSICQTSKSDDLIRDSERSGPKVNWALWKMFQSITVSMCVHSFIVNLNFMTIRRSANYFVAKHLLCKSGIWTINIFLKLFVFQSDDFNSHPGKLCLNLSLAQLIETLLIIVHHGTVVGFWINVNVRARLLVSKSLSKRSRF